MLDTRANRDRADLLRRLEREVGPVADAAVLTRAAPRSVLQRAVGRTAIAAVAIAALAIGWHLIPSDARQIAETTGIAPTAADEVARLRDALASAEEAQRNLQSELSITRRELRSLTHTPLRSWHTDTAMLQYRSPRRR